MVPDFERRQGTLYARIQKPTVRDWNYTEQFEAPCIGERFVLILGAGMKLDV